MDNRDVIRQMAWTSYAYNQAMTTIKRDLAEIGWSFERQIRLSNGLGFLFRRERDGLGYVVYKEDIADAVAWDYFDVWWDDEIKIFKRLKMHRR